MIWEGENFKFQRTSSYGYPKWPPFGQKMVFLGQKKIWAQKSHFLAKRGLFWVPVTPSTMKFEILTLPYHFHIKFTLESTKIDPYEGAIDFQSFYCNMQMRFLPKSQK